MSFRLLACTLVLPLLSACASMSEVSQTGPNTYAITYNAGAKMETWVEIKNIVRQRAQAHCASLGRRMIQPKMDSNHATGLIPKEATIQYTCAEKPAPKADANTEAGQDSSTAHQPDSPADTDSTSKTRNHTND